MRGPGDKEQGGGPHGPPPRLRAKAAALFFLHLVASFFLGALVVFLPASCRAASATVGVFAVILSENNCRFRTQTASLSFGMLDPASPSDATASATLEFICRGRDRTATYAITDDDGLNETGPDQNRMRHEVLPGRFLPYTFALSPTFGTIPRNRWQTLTLTGTVRAADLADAAAGAYTDSVTISIEP